MKNRRVKYISVEGSDGVGKTTFIRNLKRFLKSKGLNVLVTKEFGSLEDRFCRKLRGIALSSTYDPDELAGQFLFGAIARQHQVKVIRKELKAKNYDFIISDRGLDSNFVYGPVHSPQNKDRLNQYFNLVYSDAILPDLTLLLDGSRSFIQKRLGARAKESFDKDGVDRVELKGEKFQRKVRKNFLDRARKYSKRIKIINITPETSVKSVLKQGLDILKEYKLI